MRLFIFESYPVQYHAPVYREVVAQCHKHDIGTVIVFYATDAPLKGYYQEGFARTIAWDEPLLDGYDYRVMVNERGRKLSSFRSLSGKGIVRVLRRERPDAVLLTQLAYEFDWTAYLAARVLGIPVWIRTETQDQAFVRSRPKSFVRAIVYRFVYRGIRKALVIGKLNAEHYRRHGLNDTSLVWSPYSVPDRYTMLTQEEISRQRSSLREQCGFLENQTVLMFCGKLQPKKAPDLILDVLDAMNDAERSAFAMLFVGSGPLEADLRKKAARLSNVRVVFAGFKNQCELLRWYLAADVLILPSRQMGETWGLVVNEALQACKRVVLSIHVGCAVEFSTLPSVTVFDGTSDDLLRALRALPPPGSVAGQREFMQRYSVQAAAAGIVDAMRASSTGRHSGRYSP